MLKIDRAAIFYMIRTDKGAREAILSLPAPARHHHIIHEAFSSGAISRPDITGEIQGFLTNEGGFVDRKVGLQIAQKAGQIIKKHPPEDTLFSEDLW